MFVVVTGMLGVPVAVMQVIDVVVVLQGMVSAAGAVHVVVIAEVMLPVGSSAGHRSVDLPSRGCGSAGLGTSADADGVRAGPAGSLTVPSRGRTTLGSDRVKNQ